MLSLWLVLFVWLYREVDPELQHRSNRGAVTMRKWMQRLYQMSAFWQEYSLIAIALLVNALLILLVNGIYVYIVIHNGRAISAAVQITLAAFKLLYNGRFVSKVIRGSEWLHRLRKRQHLLRRGIPASAFADDPDCDASSAINNRRRSFTTSMGESLLSEDNESHGGLIPGIYSEAMLVIFNFVIAPIIAASLADTNCFYSAIVAPPPLQTSLQVSFSSPYFGYRTVNGISYPQLVTNIAENTLETDFVPPFVYSGQCLPSIIATYEPVFVLLYLANLFVVPVIMFLRRVYFKQRQQNDANTNDDRITTTELMTGSPKKAEVLRSLNFDRHTFVISRVTNLTVLLTFGWVFPPLAVLIALVEARDSIYLVAALQQYIADDAGGDMARAEKMLGWHMRGIASSLPYLQLRYLSLGALLLGLLLYDTAADELGLIAALWAPLIMFVGPWMIDLLIAFSTWVRRGGGSGNYKTQRSAAGSIYIAHSTHDDDDDDDVEEAAGATGAAVVVDDNNRQEQENDGDYRQQ